MLDNSLILMNLNSPTVFYDPSQAGINGFDDRGFLKVYQPGNTNIVKYNNDGSFNQILVPSGLEESNVTVGAGIVLGPDNLLYVADMAENSVKKYDLNGNFRGYFLNQGETVDTPEELVFGYDGNGQYSVYMTSLTGDGVKRFDWETGEELFHIDKTITPSNPFAITNPDGSVDLSASVLQFSPNGKLYISSVLSDNSIIEYNPNTNEVTEFVSQFEGAQPIPSGIAFDEQGNLYNGTFSTVGFPFPGFPTSTVASYDPQGNIIGNPYIDNANGELGVSSRINYFDLDGDGIKNFFVTDFLGGSVLEYEGPNSDNPGEFVRTLISQSVSGGPQLVNPAGLLFLSPSGKLIPVDIYAPQFAVGKSSFEITIEFGENVTGFELDDLIITNGSASKLTEIDDNSYSATIKPNGNGDLTLDLHGNAVVGENNNTNFAAPSVEVALIPQTVFGSPSMDEFDSAFPDDKLFVGEGQVLFTGSGDDYVDVSQVGSKNRIDTGSGDDIVFVGTENRVILGSGDDILFAGSGQGGNQITTGSGNDTIYLIEDQDAIPEKINRISDFNPNFDKIGFANTDLSLDNKGDLWNYQQMGNNVRILTVRFDPDGQVIPGLQEIAQLSNTTITDANFIFS